MGRIAALIRSTGLYAPLDRLVAYLRYYGRDRYIRSQLVAANEKSSDKLAIFSAVNTDRITFARRSTDFLRELGYDVALIANLDSTTSVRETFARDCRFIIDRPRRGISFCAYRDAIFSIGFAELGSYKKILLVSDDVYFPIGDVRQFKHELSNSQSDVIGLCENLGTAQYIESFFIEFSGALFTSEPMQRFWRSFTPIESRLHVIRAGERRLSEIAYRVATRVQVLYSQEKILHALVSRPATPDESWIEISELLGSDFDGIRSTIYGMAFQRDLDEMPPSAIGWFLSESIRRKLSETRSSHSLGVALVIMFGAPFVARDLYYRMSCDLAQIYLALSNIEDKQIVEDVLLDMRVRGSRQNLDIWTLLLTHLGLR